MRILCVGSMYPPHHLGGYELVWQASVEHLRGRGHAVRVLCSDHRENDRGAVAEPDVHRALRWYWRDHAFPRLAPHRVIELERANGAAFERELDEFAPDAIAWWAMGGMSLSLLERARRRRVRGAAFVIDDWLIYGPRTDAWLRFAARPGVPRKLLERVSGLPARFDPGPCARFVFGSESTRRSATARWPLPDTEVVHCGIDPSFLHAASPPGDWAWRLLYVGRIDPRKGIRSLLEAIGALPGQARLRVDGGGDEDHLRELRELAGQLGLAERVVFARTRGRGLLQGVYAQADAVVFPVLWAEPWGLVPLEAMACGRPVVATGTGGSAEYLRDGENCLLYRPGDVAGLTGCLTRLADDPALRARLRAAGLETARANTDRAFNDRVEAVLAEVARR